MGYLIAMAGKGGTGKTTIAALLIRVIKEKKLGSILAVDADPNSNLAEVLGLEIKESIGAILDDLSLHPEKVPVNMGKDAYIEYRVQTAIVEGDGFDILTMGRPEGPGCYCYVNNSLRNIMEKLINDYDFVVIDNEAGLEHLSRRTSRRADALLVVSDASCVGLRAAKRIVELTRELKLRIKKEFIIINRCGAKFDTQQIKELRLELLGFLPSDQEIEDASRCGNSLMKLGAKNITLSAIRKSGEKIWLCN